MKVQEKSKLENFAKKVNNKFGDAKQKNKKKFFQ